MIARETSQPLAGPFDRTRRFPSIVGAPANPVSRLAALGVIVAGCGSVGLNLVLHLARLGIGRLLCIDGKKIKPESLLTHPVTAAELGRPKAEVAVAQAERANLEVDARALVGRLEQQSLYDLLGYDYLVAAVDHPRAELAAGAVSRALGIPLLRPAVHGETLTAQVQCFGNRAEANPCPGCLFGTRDWRDLDAGRRFACDGSELPPGAEAPTMSLPSLCSLAADLCAHQLLRDALALGQPVRDTAISYSALAHRALVGRLTRAPDCRAAHRVLKPVKMRKPLAACTPADLLEAAALPAEAAYLAVDDDFVFVELAHCRCGRDLAPGRFTRQPDALPGCACGGLAAAVGIGTCREAPLRDWAARRAVPLAALGAAEARYAVLTAGPDGALLHGPGKEHTT